MSASVSTGSASSHGFFWSLRIALSNLFQILGFEPASKTTHSRHKKPMQRSSHSWGIFPLLRGDYIGRRRAIRRISNVVLVLFLSAVVAYGIVHMSGPAAFSLPHH